MIVESGKQNPPRLCAVDGCGGRWYARGLCSRCYQTARRDGWLPEVFDPHSPVVDPVVVDRLVAGERPEWVTLAERRQAVRHLTERGATAAQIAAIARVTPRTVVRDRQVYRDLEATG